MRKLICSPPPLFLKIIHSIFLIYFGSLSISDSEVVKSSSSVFGSNFGGSPWEEDFHWHSLSHSVRSLAALSFLLQAAREAHFLGKNLFFENMVTLNCLGAGVNLSLGN